MDFGKLIDLSFNLPISKMKSNDPNLQIFLKD